VARHSGAETVLVQLQVREGRLTLDVEDDGQGFEPASVPPPHASRRGLGLKGMRERVEVLGGTLALDAEPGQGTHVRLEIPLPQERRDG
jgi:signal transduction histidine kinase